MKSISSLLRSVMVLWTILAVALLAVPRAGHAACSTTVSYLKGQLNNITTTHGGRQRTYRVWVPADHSDLSPLIFVFHGGGGNSLQIRKQALMELVATEALVVYPDGTGAIPTWNGGICCGFAQTNNVDDIGFVRQMISEIKSNACVDPDRVYSTGMSNGGILSHRIACELPDQFAAIAGVAAQLQIASCNPSQKVGVLIIHGLDDSNVPMEGGQGCGISDTNYYPISYAVNTWAHRNSCPCQTFNGTCAQSGVEGSTTEAVCTDYCGSTIPRVRTCFGNWTHIWPRQSYTDQETFGDCPAARGPLDFNASSTAWAFFREHSLREPTSSPTSSPTKTSTAADVYPLAALRVIQSLVMVIVIAVTLLL